MILVASFIWFIACGASNLLKCHLWWDAFNLAESYWLHLSLLLICWNGFYLVYTNSCEYVMPSCFSYIFHPGIMCLPYIKVVIVSIMHEWVLKSEFCYFFLSVLLDNSKSIKRKEVSKAADKGAPSEWRASTVSTPPHLQDDFQDNTCIDTQ